MSVKNSSNILSSILKNNQSSNKQETTQTVIYLKNFGNLSGGIIKKKLATPRSVRSTSGVIGSVGSFRRGIPANENNFFSNGEEKNNQTLLLSNNKSNVTNTSFFFSSNNTPAISKNKNVNINNNLFTNTTSASTGNNIFNNLNNNLNSNNHTIKKES